MSYQSFLRGELLNGRYELVEGLNEGSFGIVSLARDTMDENKTLVALKYNTGKLSDFAAFEEKEGKEDANAKIEHPDISESIVQRETDKEVAMLLKAGTHPNIARMVDHFGTCIVLEYVARGDLHDAIQLGIAPVSTRDVVDVFMQLLEAVSHCHANGVYHRDIKPENILIADDWSIKLTDFGLATDHRICKDFDVGSERYMAPELLEHSDIETYAADKADIWSLGICLLNIVFGKSPFKSASSKDKMFLHFAANRETLFDIFPTMSYDLFSVLRSSLTIDPENRDLETMKESLKKVEVLTYDYEFEEWPKETTMAADARAAGKDGLSLPSPPGTERPLGSSAPEKSLLTAKIRALEAHEVVGDAIAEEEEASEHIAVPVVPAVPEIKTIDVNGLTIGNGSGTTTAVATMSATGTSATGTSASKKPPASASPYIPPQKRFPHGRKPLTIPTVTRRRNRSQDGRVERSPGREEYMREDFFTPRTVFNHYMEKADQHRRFDHRTREYGNEWQQQQQPPGSAHRAFGNRAWRKRRNGRPSGVNYRAGNHIKNRHTQTSAQRCSHGERNSENMGVPIGQRTDRALRPRKSQNFSSPTGKYVPPNLRKNGFPALGPATVAVTDGALRPEPLLAPPMEISRSGDDDDLFMFEDTGKSFGSDTRSTRSTTSTKSGYSVLHTPEAPKLDTKAATKQFAGLSLNDQPHRPPTLTNMGGKYVPPHHRRNSHSAVPKRYTINRKPEKPAVRMISSSVPTENTDWFIDMPQKVNWADYDDDDDDHDDDCEQRDAVNNDYISHGFGLSYMH